MPQLSKEEANAYLAHFPPIISKELVDYVRNVVFLKSRYIFTHREGKQQYGYCTHCMQEFKTSYYKHNEKVICPFCYSDCIAKDSGRGRKKLFTRAYFVYYEKSIIDPNVIVARGIEAYRDYRNYKTVTTQYAEIVWYVFDTKRGSIMFREPSWYGSWVHNRKGYEYFKKVGSYYYKYNQSNMCYVGYSRKSIEKAAKGTPFNWSGWEKYEHQDMVKFFDLYTKYPSIEYLTKLGFENLIKTKLGDGPTFGAINWRGKSLFKVLKIDKKELNDIKQNKINVTFNFLKLLQLSKKDLSNLTSVEVAEIEESYSYYIAELQKMASYTSLKKATNYLKKQYEKNKKRYSKKYNVLTTWRDYIADCIALGMNLKDEKVLFPNDLSKAHQDTIWMVKAEENTELDAKIKRRLKSLNQKYCFKYNNLIIRPAESTKELITEGKELKICVGNYSNGYMMRYADGQTDLLVVRKVSELEIPYYTMEVKNGRIVQIYGYNHSNANKEVSELLEAFKEEKLDKKSKKNREKIAIPA